jgi:hypothetical protein
MKQPKIGKGFSPNTYIPSCTVDGRQLGSIQTTCRFEISCDVSCDCGRQNGLGFGIRLPSRAHKSA